MRRIAVLALFTACLATKPDPVPPRGAQATPAPPTVALPDLISPAAVFALRTRPDLFLPLLYIKPLLGADVAPCWTDLTAKLVAAWQIQVPLPPRGRDSYFLLEGDLPRAKVESCLTTAIANASVHLREVDGLLEVSASAGRATFAAWRDNFIVVGPYDLVSAAIAPSAPDPRWAPLVTTHGNAPIYAAAIDDTMAKLFGAATTTWRVAFDRLDRSNGSFAGRIVAAFTTAGDAAIVARRIKQGELALPADSPELVDAFKRLTVKQDQAVLTITFDSSMFGGVAPAVLLGFATSILVGSY